MMSRGRIRHVLSCTHVSDSRQKQPRRIVITLLRRQLAMNRTPTKRLRRCVQYGDTYNTADVRTEANWVVAALVNPSFSSASPLHGLAAMRACARAPAPLSWCVLFSSVSLSEQTKTQSEPVRRICSHASAARAQSPSLCSRRTVELTETARFRPLLNRREQASRPARRPTTV